MLSERIFTKHRYSHKSTQRSDVIKFGVYFLMVLSFVTYRTIHSRNFKEKSALLTDNRSLCFMFKRTSQLHCIHYVYFVAEVHYIIKGGGGEGIVILKFFFVCGEKFYVFDRDRVITLSLPQTATI